MKHAGAATLAGLTPLLQALRQLPGLTERKPGIFYVKGQAYLHFHEDPAGLFADARLGGPDFERYAVNTAAERAAFLKRVTKNRIG